ncbi:MAG: hypothetical protein ACLTZM_10115 [Ruminococcus sp.]
MMKVSRVANGLFHFPGNVMRIYPGNAIGLGSAPEELEVARNTVQIHALVENALGELEYRKALEEAEFADKDNANNLLFNSNGELENSEAYSNGMESAWSKNPHFYKAGACNASNPKLSVFHCRSTCRLRSGNHLERNARYDPEPGESQTVFLKETMESSS